jgi:hypothetical protein
MRNAATSHRRTHGGFPPDSDVAVIGPQMRRNGRQVDEPVDLAQHVTVGNMPLQAEAVEQRLLQHPPFAHHRESPRFIDKYGASIRMRKWRPDEKMIAAITSVGKGLIDAGD